tara:strand:- start:8732 stop:9271 length:540 start_codon:yes stop_codon:yes gene_type:complete
MPINISFQKREPAVQAQIPLKISKTLDGNLIIDDHECMDIVVNPMEGRIITLPKPYAEKDVYEYQRDLMYYLFKGGVTDAAVPTGGAAFGMVEASYPTKSSIHINSLQSVLYLISEYIATTAHDEDLAKEYDKNIEDRFVDPPDSETTALGQVQPYEDNPEAYQTGDPTYSFAGYGYYY